MLFRSIDGSITLSDVDSTNLTSATVTITSPVSGDVLNFADQNGISGSFAAGVLTLTGFTTLANYQTALRSVTFSNATSDDPTVGGTRTSREVTWAVTDANSDAVGAQTSVAVTSTINVTAVNDAPTLTANQAVGGTFTEGDGSATGSAVSLFRQASASALAPSYIPAFATSMPVSSQTSDWNSKIVCSVPWLISGW